MELLGKEPLPGVPMKTHICDGQDDRSEDSFGRRCWSRYPDRDSNRVEQYFYKHELRSSRLCEWWCGLLRSTS